MIKSFSPLHAGADLKINLEKDHIILHGSTDEAAGVVLRGSVILNCHEHIKVKGIKLNFTGNVHVHWVEGPSQKHYKDKKVIMQKEWQFLPKGPKVYHFDKGEQYHYDFELALPGHLPATFHHSIGSLVYQFKAQVDRPTFSSNYSTTREIQIIRTPYIQLTQQPQEISNTWANKVAYRIHVPSQLYWASASIPVTFDFTPLCDQLQVQSIRLVLKEYIQFRAGDHVSTERKVLTSVCDKHFKRRARRLATGGWSKTENILVPDPVEAPHHGEMANGVHVDVNEDLFHVYHKLKVSVSFVNPDGHISELRVSVPLSLVEMVPEEDVTVLPAYEDAWRSAPYHPTDIANSDTSSSNRHSYASSASFSSEDDVLPCEQDTLPWMGVDLSRVPSYATALRTGRLYSYSGYSLPTYDSIAV
ncbi:hypothetical protein BC941DRAFT_410554 [Chlamydoabsidia padenii]|nr:hypothetical protein BC941DRAFT_410554 [Chlamydoabsidia padenii]